jgi:hypothetical protein
MAESFLSLFRCLKKEPSKTGDTKQSAHHKGTQVKPAETKTISGTCSKCGETLGNAAAKSKGDKIQPSINNGGEGEQQSQKQGKRVKIQFKSDQAKTDDLCDKCHNELQNTDNNSTFSQSTAYGSTKGRRRQKGDSDGGEPKSNYMEAEFNRRPYRKYLFLPGHKASITEEIDDREYDQ